MIKPEVPPTAVPPWLKRQTNPGKQVLEGTLLLFEGLAHAAPGKNRHNAPKTAMSFIENITRLPEESGAIGEALHAGLSDVSGIP
jgi:hypothetical protein